MQKSNNNTNSNRKMTSSKRKQPQDRRPGQVPRAVSVPAAIGVRSQSRLPAEVVITHREMVGAITYSNVSGFTLRGLSGAFPGYDLNPGSTTMFPWLSTIARGFEKYRFEALKFDLIPRVSTQAVGGVMVGIDYDWDDNVATSSVELMANRGAVAASLWQPLTVVADCRLMNQDMPYRYVEAVGRQLDSQRMMYAGFLQVATTGTAAAGSADLFVDYTVRLALPAIHDSTSSATGTTGAITLAAATQTAFPTLFGLPGLKRIVVGENEAVGAPAIWQGLTGWKITGGAKGRVQVECRPSTAGQPPSAYASDTQINFCAMDGAGTVLTSTVQDGGVTYFGPTTAAEWATNGAQAKAIVGTVLKALREWYPTVQYLIPYLYSVAGRNIDASSTYTLKYTDL